MEQLQSSHIDIILKKHSNNSHRILTNVCNTFGTTIPKQGCDVGQELYNILSQKIDNNIIRFINGSFYRGYNTINKDSIIEPGCMIVGGVTVNHSNSPSTIGAGSFVKDCIIVDSRLDAGVIIEGGQHTKIQGSTVGKNTVLFGGARVRDSHIGAYNEIGYGEFVRTTTGKLMKALHSCYLGDTDVGDSVNIANQFGIVNSGPGGIKSKTIIGNNVFTGGGARIVPGKKGVKVGDGAIIAAGATVLCNIPENHTYISKDRIYPHI